MAEKSSRITSDELRKINNIELPMRAKDFSDASFWYYTSMDTAIKILENKKIFISNISKMNDLDEDKLHGNDSKFVHCLCLCNSDTEKIPMWYLYAGLTGKGVAIKFTPSIVLKLLDSIETVKTIDGRTVFERGKDFDIDWGWIFYQKKEHQSSVKFKGTWYSVEDSDNFAKKNYFIKAYPWEYEREFRIVIHNNAKPKIAYDQLAIDISPVFDRLKIKLGPETSQKEFLKEYKKATGRTVLPLSIEESKLGISMNLLDRNFGSLREYLADGTRQSKSKRESEAVQICKALRDSGYDCEKVIIKITSHQ